MPLESTEILEGQWCCDSNKCSIKIHKYQRINGALIVMNTARMYRNINQRHYDSFIYAARKYQISISVYI